MATSNFVINGKPVEWADLSVSIAGVKIDARLKGLTVQVSQDKEAIHAGGNTPVSINRGNITYSGTLTVLESVLNALDLAVKAAGGKDVLGASFDIVGSLRMQGVRGLKQFMISGAEFTSFNWGMMQGDKQMPISLPFIALDMTIL